MESRLYAYPRYGKSVKSTSSLIRYVNACKISITLSNRQSFKLIAILENNTTNCPNLPLDKEGISSRVSNHGKKGITLADNNNDNIRPANID